MKAKIYQFVESDEFTDEGSAETDAWSKVCMDNNHFHDATYSDDSAEPSCAIIDDTAAVSRMGTGNGFIKQPIVVGGGHGTGTMHKCQITFQSGNTLTESITYKAAQGHPNSSTCQS